jgi:hypothetical protein
MNRLTLALACSLIAAVVLQAPAAERLPEPLAFEFSYADPAKGDGYPYFRAFDGGKDRDGQDASGALSTLKFARGASKLYPREDAEPGMIVVLRRIVMVPRSDGHYTAILEGEYNAVQSVIRRETIEKLLSGEVTDLVFTSDTTKGIRPVAYRVQAQTRFRAQLRDGNLHFYGGEGRSVITHYGLRREHVFESEAVPLGDVQNTKPVYIGKNVKPTIDRYGRPETLPVIN